MYRKQNLQYLKGRDPVRTKIVTDNKITEQVNLNIFFPSGATALQGFGRQSGRQKCQLLRIEGCHVVSATDPHGR